MPSFNDLSPFTSKQTSSIFAFYSKHRVLFIYIYIQLTLKNYFVLYLEGLFNIVYSRKFCSATTTNIFKGWQNLFPYWGIYNHRFWPYICSPINFKTKFNSEHSKYVEIFILIEQLLYRRLSSTFSVTWCSCLFFTLDKCFDYVMVITC